MSGKVAQPLFSSSIFSRFCEPDNGHKTTLDVATEHTVPVPDFTTLEDRIKSYVNWPNKQISKEVLAKAGFYYKNHDDVVECPFCHIEGYQWVAGDNPMEDHRRWSPNCPFVRTSIEHDNTSSTSSSRASRNLDTCGLYGVEILPNSVPEDDRKIDLEKLGIQQNKGPAHPEKFSYESRLETFSQWPKSLKQTPQQLAEAGFFYLGVGDQTLCFHCNGGLRDWEENDEPWAQHALWFPKCNYLHLKKGQEFIEQVKLKKEPQAAAAVPGTSGSSSPETKEEANESSSVNKCKSTSEGNKEAEEKTLCKICYKNELGVVFLPCGHIVACVECSAALKKCAVCRKPLEATVRAFLS